MSSLGVLDYRGRVSIWMSWTLVGLWAAVTVRGECGRNVGSRDVEGWVGRNVSGCDSEGWVGRSVGSRVGEGWIGGSVGIPDHERCVGRSVGSCDGEGWVELPAVLWAALHGDLPVSS